jgi:hypothetical protein
MKAVKYILFIVIIIIAVVFLSVSCKKEDTKGTPVIDYIRVTNPDQADSLLVQASMGSLVVIIGENLGDVIEVWFNDLQADITPPYITDNSILVNVPSVPPGEINNRITLVTNNGTTYQYDFRVVIPPPVITSAVCEYVPDGGTFILNGNFLFDPHVIFPGGLEGEVISSTQTQVQVKVPAGATSGPVIVNTLFGTATSRFHFRDQRGLFWDFDTRLGGGWRPGRTRSTNPAGVSGNYVYLTGRLADYAANNWAYVDDFLEIDLWGQSGGRPNAPLWDGGIAGKTLKFEAYTVNPWSAGWMQLIFSPWNNANNNVTLDNTVARGFWRPWVDADGSTYNSNGWVTVSVPLSTFIYNRNATINNLSLIYPDNCGSLSVFVYGPVGVNCDVNILLDNFRVVDE